MKHRKKQVVVIGLGQFGLEVARSLARQCEVLVVDMDAKLIDEVNDEVTRALSLDVRDFGSLSAVVTPEFDEAVVAISGNLGASVLAVLHLKKIGLRNIIAKALNEDHAAILRAVGASEIIFPERETARRVAARILHPRLLDIIPLAENYRILEIAPPDAFYGKSLAELDLRKRFDIFVIAVKELVPERTVFLPPAETVIKPSDILIVIGREEDIETIR